MLKEKFISLAQAMGKAEMGAKLLSMLELNLETIVDYVKAVYMLEINIQIVNARTDDPREAAERIADLDRRRRDAHNAAIAAISACNRMSDRFGVEHIYSGDIEDRCEVADFCGDFVIEVYGSRDKASYTAKRVLDKLMEA